MKTKLLAFGHRSGVGKDTAAEMAKTLIGPLFCDTFAFADELKLECYQLFGTLPPDRYDDDRSLRSKKVDGLELTPVELWVKFGEACREIDPLIWVNKTLELIGCWSPNVAILTDLRHPNEAKRLKELGAVLVKVESNVPPNPQAKIDAYLSGYDGWNYEIYADHGDLLGLETEVKRVLKSEALI